jgi:hypothetical protein
MDELQRPVEVEMIDDATTHDRGSSTGWVRAAALACTVGLLTGVAGFALGRASAPNDASTVASETDVTSPTPVTEAPEVPEVTEATAGTDDIAEAPAATIAGSAGDSESSYMPGGGSGMVTNLAYAEEAKPLLAERTLDDGSVIRVHGTQYGSDMYGNPWQGFPNLGDWKPEPWCSPSGDLRISVATPDSVNTGWAPWYTEPKDGLAVNTFATGYVEDAPRFGAVVQVTPDATAVTFTTASGSDTAPVTNGFALVLVTGPIDDGWSMSIDRPTGATTIDQPALMEVWSSSEYRSGCEPPPPPLPPAGEQPADRDAAEAAVRAAWDTAHAYADQPIELRLAAIDDAKGVQDAWEAIGEGEYAEAARTSTSPIRELVFTSPTEAWFRYDLETSITDFPNRWGIARLGDDGAWRITRASICQDIMLAPGFGCVPSVSQVLPPSAEDDPRYGAPWPADSGAVPATTAVLED